MYVCLSVSLSVYMFILVTIVIRTVSFLLQFHIIKKKNIDTLLLLILCKILIDIIRYYKYIIRYKIGKIYYKTKQIEG